MTRIKRLTDAETLETYRVALTNTETNPEVSSKLEELGYNSEKMNVGKQLLAATRTAYEKSVSERKKMLAASLKFKTKKKNLNYHFRKHRYKAKVIYRKDPEILEKLYIAGIVPGTYVAWIESAKNFYQEIAADQGIQDELAILKFTPEDLKQAQSGLIELEALRASYIKEKGFSQDAREAKDAALKNLADWMNTFYAVARIAFENKPQLQEILGKVVKS